MIKSINAKHMDDLMRGLVLDHLKRSHGIELIAIESGERDQRLRELIQRVVVAPEALTIELTTAALTPPLMDAPRSKRRKTGASGTVPTCPFTPSVAGGDGVETLTLPIRIKRHDGKRILLSPEGHDLLLTMSQHGKPLPKAYLVSAVGQAFALHLDLMRTRDTIEVVASRFGITEAWARVLLDITTLSPTILKAVLTGTLPPTVTLMDLRDAAQHLDWSLQEAALRS